MWCRPTNKVTSKLIQKFLTRGGLHEDKLCDTLQTMATDQLSKRFIKPPYSISGATSIESSCCRLPTPTFSATKRTNHAPRSSDQQAPVSQGHTSYSVFVFFPFILNIKFVGRTSRGHSGGRSHRISHPPSFCGTCLNFSREKDSAAIPFPSSTVRSNFVY